MKRLSDSTNSALIPLGGITGQVPVKQSDEDRDVAWGDGLPSGGNYGDNLVRNVNGNAAWVNPNSVSAAMQFESTKNHHINCGVYFRPNTDYFSCFYEAWVYVNGASEYIVSDGYGGAHDLLWGVLFASGRYSITGNFKNGVNDNNFGSFDTFGQNEWHHVAIGYSHPDQMMICYLDGVPCGIAPFTGTARNTLSNPGTGIFFIGGSDHSNFNGRIKNLRGYEFPSGEYPPIYNAFAAPAKHNMVFRPEKVFRGRTLDMPGTRLITPSILLDFSTYTRGTIPDLMGKYHGKRASNINAATHDSGAWGDSGIFNDSESNYAEVNLPQFVPADFAEPEYSGNAPGAIPAGALIYDDYRRKNVTYAWNASLGIGNARTGQPNESAYSNTCGIINEQMFSTFSAPMIWNAGAANQDVTLTRRANGTYSPQDFVAIVIRYTDDSNYIWAYATTGSTWNIILRVGGVNTSIGSGALPGGLQNFTSLRFVANGANGYFYVNGTQLGGTLNISTVPLGNRAGIYTSGNPLSRYDEFKVLAS